MDNDDYIYNDIDNYNHNFLASYNADIRNGNNISILLGNEYQKSQNQYSSLNAIDAIGPFYEQGDLDTTLTLTSPSSRYSFVSYFARGKYSIKDKYFVQGTMRVDGSSRFGANNQYGYFRKHIIHQFRINIFSNKFLGP